MLLSKTCHGSTRVLLRCLYASVLLRTSLIFRLRVPSNVIFNMCCYYIDYISAEINVY